jgi:hypothetical protein
MASRGGDAPVLPRPWEEAEEARLDVAELRPVTVSPIATSTRRIERWPALASGGGAVLRRRTHGPGGGGAAARARGYGPRLLWARRGWSGAARMPRKAAAAPAGSASGWPMGLAGLSVGPERAGAGAGGPGRASELGPFGIG